MDPFHVVHLAADAVDECRRRTQQDIFGRRGRAPDPLYRARRSLHTGADLLTTRHNKRPSALFTDKRHAAVEITRGVYQRMITTYRDPDRATATATMTTLIHAIATGVPRRAARSRPPGTHLAQTRRRRARVLRSARHIQRPHPGHQRTTRTPTRHRPGLPQPHPLHRPQPPRNRRDQTSPTPLTGKSQNP